MALYPRTIHNHRCDNVKSYICLLPSYWLLNLVIYNCLLRAVSLLVLLLYPEDGVSNSLQNADELQSDCIRRHSLKYTSLRKKVKSLCHWLPHSSYRARTGPMSGFCFFLGLLFDPEDGGVMLLRNVVLSPNYTELQIRRFAINFAMKTPGNPKTDYET